MDNVELREAVRMTKARYKITYKELALRIKCNECHFCNSAKSMNAFGKPHMIADDINHLFVRVSFICEGEGGKLFLRAKRKNTLHVNPCQI